MLTVGVGPIGPTPRTGLTGATGLTVLPSPTVGIARTVPVVQTVPTGRTRVAARIVMTDLLGPSARTGLPALIALSAHTVPILRSSIGPTATPGWPPRPRRPTAADPQVAPETAAGWGTGPAELEMIVTVPIVPTGPEPVSALHSAVRLATGPAMTRPTGAAPPASTAAIPTVALPTVAHPIVVLGADGTRVRPARRSLRT